LRASIKADPENWQNYIELGLAIVHATGRFDEASRVFLSYPGFKDQAPQDPVELSNQAYEAGSLLFWDGQTDLSKPLFKIAADLHTGSSSSMTSKARLLLLSGNYAGATARYQERAARYPSSYALRDYLSLLHALGSHDAAWQAFSQVNASFNSPHAWVSALVGQRMQGWDEPRVREWLLKPEIRGARFNAWRFAAYYSILWNATDRDPPADLGTLIERLDGEPYGHIDVDGSSVLVPHPADGNRFMLLRPSGFRQGKSSQLPSGTSVKSPYAYFGDAYAALRAQDFATGYARFVAMADRYPIEGYPLAYFAYAAARNGDREHLETYVDSLPSSWRQFDYWLAKAFFADARKDANGAYQSLQNAFRMRSSSDNDDRPLMTEYQYAQACEWLYRDTGDLRFATELLRWTKRYEAIVPAQGWAYAMEYMYDAPGADRVRALAMSRYLDPQSPRIRAASADEVQAADAWFRANNPFRRTTRDPDSESKEKIARH
jgi:hypothetical protein